MIPEWDLLKKTLWLEDKLAKVNPKDFDGRAAIAKEYSKLFGYAVELFRCVSRFGESAGQFWGYNVIEMNVGVGVFYERERIA